MSLREENTTYNPKPGAGVSGVAHRGTKTPPARTARLGFTAARVLGLVLAAPLFAMAVAVIALFALVAFVVEAAVSALENRKPRWPAQIIFCTCKTMGGPAADYEHHERTCRYARVAGRFDAAHEDPKTGWVTVAR